MKEDAKTETEILRELREQIRAEIYRDLSKKGNAARKGTAKAQKHARLIGLKGSLAARRKAMERRAAKAAEATEEAK